MAETWEKMKSMLLASATKWKVSNVKIPDPKVSYTKFAADMARLSKEYDSAVASLQTKIVAMKQQCGNIRPAMQMFDDQCDKNNFNLDPKDPNGNGAEAIMYFRGNIQGFVGEKLKAIDAVSKTLDTAEKNSKALQALDLDL